MMWQSILKRDRVEHFRQLYLQFNSDSRNLHGQSEDGGMNIPENDLPEDVRNVTEENLDEVIMQTIANWNWMLGLEREASSSLLSSATQHTDIEAYRKNLKRRKEITQFIQDLEEI